MRAYWKGHLRLSLVTIAVELHAATEATARPELHQIDRKTGKRIRYEKIVPGKGPVDAENIVRGFELGSGKHVILTPEELDKIKLETKHSIDLAQFAPLFELPDPFALGPGEVDPFGLRNRLSKPLVMAVHGITYTIGIEMLLDLLLNRHKAPLSLAQSGSLQEVDSTGVRLRPD